MPAAVNPTAYLSAWLNRYPDAWRPAGDNAERRIAENAFLAAYARRDALSREEVEALIDWKWEGSLPGRHARAQEYLLGDRWDRVSELIEGALVADDDHEALWRLTVQGGGL